MKKTYLAATLMALVALLSACNKNDDIETRFEEPRFLQYAGRLSRETPPSLASASRATTKVPPAAILESFELTESGLYAIGEWSGDELRYRTGDYTVDGNVYTLNGYGSIEFENAQSGPVTLYVTPTGGETIEAPAYFTKSTGKNDLYRGWTVDKTRVTVKGWTSDSADFSGCNFYEIAKFLRDNGHKVPDEIDPSLALRTISFTGTGTMLFAYSDGSADVSEYKFNGSSFTYRWNDDKMGFTFLTDQAVVEYMDGKCILTINADIQNSTTSGSVTFVLSPLD